MENCILCSECHREIKNKQYDVVDGRIICYHCLFGHAAPVSIYPIGYVRLVFPDGKSVITLYPKQKPFMYRLEEEEQITVIYFLHQIDSIRSVFHRGKGGKGKEVGVFASRTPRRTSRIGISQVKLLSVQELDIRVEGLDAFQDSPVLDIKAVMKKK